VQLLGAGAILREVEAAAALLEAYGVVADVWSVTSVNELYRDGRAVRRWNLLHPEEEPRVPYIAELLGPTQGPVIIATDYLSVYSEQLRAFVPRSYHVLGTDGFGRSDTRGRLRQFFEVGRNWVAWQALCALAQEVVFERARLAQARHDLGIDPDKPDPLGA
jgi:pyruvate dehydrogenase E1 component